MESGFQIRLSRRPLEVKDLLACISIFAPNSASLSSNKIRTFAYDKSKVGSEWNILDWEVWHEFWIELH